MNEIYIGTTLIGRLQEGQGNSIAVTDAGVASATCVYHTMFASAAQLVRAAYRHPTYSWLVRKGKATIEQTDAGYARVTINYEGVDPDQSSGSADGERGPDGEIVTYSLETTLNSEPIETHPDFPTFAGKPFDKTTWVNGARFNEKDGAFLGFSPSSTAVANPKAGVRNYLNPSIIYVRTRTLSDIGKVRGDVAAINLGRIDTPPASSYLPATVDGQNWLKVYGVATAVGLGVQIVEKWQLSGRGGWDADIYGA